LQTFRSAATRPINDTKIIDRMAGCTQIIVLARTSLSFHNVAALADATENAIAQASTHVRHCIIDFAAVTSVSFDSCQTFAEILEHAHIHDFQLIFTGLQDDIVDALVRAGVPIMFGVLSVEQLDGDARECVLCPIVPDRRGVTKTCAELDTALALCEDDLLFHSTVDGSALTPTDATQNQDQDNSRRIVVSAFPELSEQAVTPVIVDMYNWSNGYLPAGAFEMDMLRVLSQFLEIRDFSIGDCIYKLNSELPREPTGAPNSANTPPLVWLLHGAIEHQWSNASAFGPTPEKIASNYKISDGSTFETAEVNASAVGRYAVGPLATHNAFFACMPHCGIIVAVAGSRPCRDNDVSTAGCSARPISCAILTREAYDCMRKDHPDVANLLVCHCARKRWTNMAKSVNDGCPTLAL
jgi:anti-anti-sigma regulatory factor